MDPDRRGRAGHPVQQHRGPADFHRAASLDGLTFQLVVSDGQASSNPATVAITVASTAAGPDLALSATATASRRTPARARPPARRSTGRSAAIPGTIWRSGPP